MQAVADVLCPLANIVMACNTAKMQAIFDRRTLRRSGAVPPELIAWVAPAATGGLNKRDAEIHNFCGATAPDSVSVTAAAFRESRSRPKLPSVAERCCWTHS
jgi:hypothetical protein